MKMGRATKPLGSQPVETALRSWGETEGGMLLQSHHQGGKGGISLQAAPPVLNPEGWFSIALSAKDLGRLQAGRPHPEATRTQMSPWSECKCSLTADTQT